MTAKQHAPIVLLVDNCKTEVVRQTFGGILRHKIKDDGSYPRRHQRVCEEVLQYCSRQS